MRADILVRRDLRTRGRWWTGLRLAYAAERKIAQRRQRPGGDTRTFQKAASIQLAARFTWPCAGDASWSSTTFRLFDQHRRLPLSGWIAVDAIEVLNLGGVSLVSRPALFFEVNRLGGRRRRHQRARGGACDAGNRCTKQIAPTDQRLRALLHEGRTPPKFGRGHKAPTAQLGSSSGISKLLLTQRYDNRPQVRFESSARRN